MSDDVKVVSLTYDQFSSDSRPKLPEFLPQKHFLKVSVVGESLALIHSSALNSDELKSGSRFLMSDDYKVVSLTYLECYPTRSRPKVEVYTVKTGIWREVIFPHNLSCFYIQSEWSQIFSNGCVHWICTSDSNWSHYSILTFDINTELFGEILLPEFLAHKHLKISVVGESLAVIHSSCMNFDGLKSTGNDVVFGTIEAVMILFSAFNIFSPSIRYDEFKEALMMNLFAFERIGSKLGAVYQTLIGLRLHLRSAFALHLSRAWICDFRFASVFCDSIWNFVLTEFLVAGSGVDLEKFSNGDTIGI
ncbi:hypothetical protein OSB04_013202 [Centaurea solstitialis]|uniref:F-box associated beta-propeller type 1 domain-containing protein n=1 Tax=Centaurea solstitialis TaxID=347529 RepID=A0AA38TKC6_9ASTR|nr:hypothetical protein OSB04_013202 [Centaurea solstitialis]